MARPKESIRIIAGTVAVGLSGLLSAAALGVWAGWLPPITTPGGKVQGSGLVWLWGGIGLVIVMLIAGAVFLAQTLASSSIVKTADATGALTPEPAVAPPAGKPEVEEGNLLRALFDNLPDFIAVKDNAGRILFTNLAQAWFLGANTSAEIAGKTLANFFPAELAQTLAEDDRKLLETGQPLINAERLVPDRLGRLHWLSMTLLPMRDQDGRVTSLLSVSQDITSRKQAEFRLKNYAAKLQNSNRELQDFAYVASHDLQEPLRKVYVFGDRLKAKFGNALPADGQQYLERMQESTRRMQTLINDLLAFSRVATQVHPFVLVNLADVAKEVLSDLELRIQQSGGRVEVGELPTLEADARQMRQLLQNLVGNALKFHQPNTPPAVQIRGELLPESEACRITVTDAGIGFDEKYLDRIFQVFQRLHTRGTYEGTGIGLAICRKIVMHHNGEITAQSKPGEGATFIVTLPLQQPKGEIPS
jgi:PAS domain S-box-containing protein